MKVEILKINYDIVRINGVSRLQLSKPVIDLVHQFKMPHLYAGNFMLSLMLLRGSVHHEKFYHTMS